MMTLTRSCYNIQLQLKQVIIFTVKLLEHVANVLHKKYKNSYNSALQCSKIR